MRSSFPSRRELERGDLSGRERLQHLFGMKAAELTPMAYRATLNSERMAA